MKRRRFVVYHDDERSSATGDGFVSSHDTMERALAKAGSMGIDGYWYGQFFVIDEGETS